MLYLTHHLGDKKDRTNFAFCPPDGNYGTIDAYEWKCPKGPNGKKRKKAQYFSNPDVCHEEVPTGDAYNNNAGHMIENRFKYRDVGSNCLDGNPDEKWKFGKKCKNGEKSFEVPINKLEGNIYCN